jgi:hypothetical protein
MTHSRFIVVGLVALAALAAAPVLAEAVASNQAQTLVLDAVFDDMRAAGPGPSHVGHQQIASGSLDGADGRRVGSFSFTCTWTMVGPGGARERCRASALTADGELDAAGPAASDSVTHTWSVTGGTGAYRGAAGTVLVRDLGDRESLITATLTTHGHVALRAGRVNRPRADETFTARANGLCQAAAERLAMLPPFPLVHFDPLHPDPSSLPAVGAFFTGPGDPRPILRALITELHGLGEPAAGRDTWRSVLAARRHVLAVMAEQDRAALGGDVHAFVRSVEASAASFRQVAISAMVFGVTRCVL